MKSRIFVKLFAAALLIIAVCALTMNVLIHKAWDDMLRSEIETSLRQKTLLFASRIESTPPDSIPKVTREHRDLAGRPCHRHRSLRQGAGRFGSGRRCAWRTTLRARSLWLHCKAKWAATFAIATPWECRFFM